LIRGTMFFVLDFEELILRNNGSNEERIESGE
jgi:hypothetical protein